MPLRWLFLLSVLLCLPASAGDEPARVTPYADAASARPSLEEEDRIWAEGAEGERALVKSGNVYDDPVLTAYLQGVMDRIFPEFAGAIRVRVAPDSGLNAFALPQGVIFFNMGLLARLENEAQLATILAHEGTHFTHRHGYQNSQSAKSVSGFAMTVGMIGGGVGVLLGNLAAISSMSGFSRDMEREADRQGFERMARAGYDVRESVKGFQLLADEVKVIDIKEPFFFASHPRLQERIESFKALIGGYAGPAGETGEAKFAGITRPLREKWLQAQLGEGKPKSIIHVLSNPDMLAHYPVHAAYYLGEAYRLRGNDGDTAKAIEAWQTAIRKAPEFAPSYRAQGIQQMKAGEWMPARESLQRYLALAPNAGDILYVQEYLERIEEKLKQ